jgi:hypothetical protein
MFVCFCLIIVLLQPPVVVAGGAPVPLMAGVPTNVFYPYVASLDFSHKSVLTVVKDHCHNHAR